ncbi:DNA polymerase I [Desulfovibrio aminophilus]|uniref:DNA polymerase I n=1 Tax=Desulfovibrio aminophilus TaxID=81425 RepID=UPI003395CD69
MSIKERLRLDTDPVFLIDGSSFLHRSYHANPDLKRSDGFPTNALYGVLRVLLRLLREEKPKYVGFFLDGPKPTFRHELFPAYKANRPKMPEPLAKQIAPLLRAVELMGLTPAVSDGVEADDCIASLAAAFKDRRPVVIVASDKDLKQCLDENVVLWDPASKQDKITTRADLLAETGLAPGQWADFQALTGDSTDNIPGLPGVGPKTALKLLADFPSLEALRAHLAELPEKLRAKVDGRLEDLFLYRELTRMKTDVLPGTLLEDLAPKPADLDAFADFLREYEFRSMLRDLPRTDGIPPAAVPLPEEQAKTGKPRQQQFSLFDAPAPKPAGPPLDVPERAPKALPSCTGKHLGLVPVEGGFRLGLDGHEYFCPGPAAELAPILSRARSLAVPGLQDLLRADDAWRAVPLAAWFDCSLAAYLLNPEDRNYSWERLRQSLNQDVQAEEIHPESQGLAALAFRRNTSPRLEAAGLDRLMRTLELPLVPVLVDMERAGIAIDREAFSGFLDEVGGQIEALTARILELAGESFNVRSSPQTAVVLFQKLGLKPAGKTPGGALSTSNDVLERLAGQHPIVDAILEFRMLEKLRSTYLEPLPKLAGEDGRIHTHFNQLATATGRLSSSGPNLQNIPVRGPQGQRMRACFTAGTGNLLASADYSQVELRVLAHFSKDRNLIEAFARDEDIHARTAAILFDKEPAQVTPDERRNAKTINFGLIYGMGPQKLARELSISMNQAKEFIERYFARLTTLRDFYENLVEEAGRNGFVTTLAGRRRLLPELGSRNQQLASQARRQAINTVIQGSAADIIKMAMLTVAADQELRALDARLTLQIHDELVLEAPAANIEAAGTRLRRIMQNVARLDTPLKVDLGTGRTWAEAH